MGKRNINVKNILKPEEYEYSVVIPNDKAKDKLVKTIERIVRSSKEYRDYIGFAREYMDMSQCAFFNGVSNKDTKKVKIELHHEPFTLYDIVQAVIDRWLDEAIPLNTLYIADEVMNLHYANKVGLIPLGVTIHQIVHKTNDFIIPLNLVSGNYTTFVEEYMNYLDLDKLERKINETKMVNASSYNMLDVTFEYIDVEGFVLPKKIEKEKVS